MAAVCRVSFEPACDVAFSAQGMLIAAHDGSLKAWQRPAAAPARQNPAAAAAEGGGVGGAEAMES